MAGGTLPWFVKTKEQPYAEGSGGVGEIEQESRLPAGKHADTHHAEDEGGAGIVAESEHPLRLGFGAKSLFVESEGGSGTGGIATNEAKGEGGGTFAGDTKQRDHQRGEKPSQTGNQPKLHGEGGEGEEGEQGGEDDLKAEGKSVLCGMDGLRGKEEEGGDTGEQTCLCQQEPQSFMGEKSGQHRRHHLSQRYEKGGRSMRRTGKDGEFFT